MCLILFSFQPQTNTPLMLAANRDEFFARQTASAHFWEDAPHLLAGKDLQAGGTWLGMTKSGRFAAITNVREPGVMVDNPRSRGELTRDFLLGQESPDTYLQAVSSRGHRYAGFNVLVGDLSPGQEQLWYFSNRQPEIRQLTSGIYGLSNHLLDTDWPKVTDGKHELQRLLCQSSVSHAQIRRLLENPATADDSRLPETGVGYDREKALSARFIVLPDYGTRTTTVVTVQNGQWCFSEQNYRASSQGCPLPEGEESVFDGWLKETTHQPANVV